MWDKFLCVSDNINTLKIKLIIWELIVKRITSNTFVLNELVHLLLIIDFPPSKHYKSAGVNFDVIVWGLYDYAWGMLQCIMIWPFFWDTNKISIVV